MPSNPRTTIAVVFLMFNSDMGREGTGAIAQRLPSVALSLPKNYIGDARTLSI